MSYSKSVKEELILQGQYDKYEIYGLLTSRHFSFIKGEICLHMGSVARHFVNSIKSVYDPKAKIKPNGKRYIVAFDPSKLPHELDNDTFKEIKRSKSKRSSYLRGLFLSSGYVSDPSSSYALDFVVEREEDATLVRDLIRGMGMKAGISVRKKSFLIYVRNFEDVPNLLIMVGATETFFEYEELKIFREMREQAIRTINLEVSNDTKILTAASKHIDLIKEAEEKLDINRFSEKTLEFISARKECPEASLDELSVMLGISKSGVRSRIRGLERIVEMSK